MLASELVPCLRQELTHLKQTFTWDYQPLATSLEPQFFGAGGPQMAAAGVQLAVDMTAHSIIGVSAVVRHYFKFRSIFRQLRKLALKRQPDAIVCVDFSGFNRRFAQSIKQFVGSRLGWFHDWDPKLIQYVSPQVWASRPGRAYQMARDFDLLLSIIPFEQEWYAKRVPDLPVTFVGHPLVDRYSDEILARRTSDESEKTRLLLLPGSRAAELARHLPVMLEALCVLRQQLPALRTLMVLPNEALLKQAQSTGLPPELDAQIGGLAAALSVARVAIASTGTVTLECAFCGVPTVAMYKTSWATYQIAKSQVQVKYLAMPNLLAKEELFPEFIQHEATPEAISRAALDLWRDEERRRTLRSKLTEISASLGPRGATRRAARAIARLLDSPTAAAHRLADL